MKFKIGDHVRVTARPCRHFDQVGTVDVVNDGAQYPYRLTGLADHPLYFGPHELVLAEAPASEVAA